MMTKNDFSNFHQADTHWSNCMRQGVQGLNPRECSAQLCLPLVMITKTMIMMMILVVVKSKASNSVYQTSSARGVRGPEFESH